MLFVPKVPPLVTSSMNVVGALLGTDVRLTCNVESHPPSINYWMKGRQQDQHNTILPRYALSSFVFSNKIIVSI
jgi:hypothetical protein